MLSLHGLLVSTLPFFYATLEQYYTGKLVLGPINGIDEGSFVFIGLCFISGYYGSANLMTQEFLILGSSLKLSEILHHIFAVTSYIMVIPK